MRHTVTVVSSAASAASWCKSLGEHFDVLQCGTADDVHASMTTSHCGVVVAAGDDLVAALSDFAGLGHCPRCIFVGRGGPPQPIARIVYEMVEPSEAPDALLSVVTGSIIDEIIQRGLTAARRLIWRRGDARHLGLALEACFKGEAGSVAGLSRVAGRSVRHLQGVWHERRPKGSCIGLKAVLSAVFVLDCIQIYLRDPSNGWTDIAKHQGVSAATLRRRFGTIIRSSPGSLTLSHLPAAVSMTEETLVTVLHVCR